MADAPFKLFDPDHIWTAPETSRPAPKYHRLQTVRQKQCISLRDVAVKTGVSVEMASREENGEADLTLGRLFEWQKALGVPISDLLVSNQFPSENEEIKSIAKTIQLAKQTLQRSDSPDVRSMTQAIIEELNRLMSIVESANAKESVKRAGS